MSSRLVQTARLYLRELGGEPTVAVLGASALLVLAHHHGSASFFRQHLAQAFAGHPAAGALPFLYWFGASVVFYLGAPLALAALTGGGFTRRYGLGLGDWRAGLKIVLLFLAVMLPLVLVAARWPSFKGQYPLAGGAAYTLTPPGARSAGLFAVYELFYAAYFVGWEFLFRGYLTHAVLPRWGRAAAILVPTAPFVVMHLGKPELEALGAVIAGVALGVLALRTRSFWYGAVLHAAVAVWMDLVSAWPYLPRP